VVGRTFLALKTKEGGILDPHVKNSKYPTNNRSDEFMVY